MREFKFFTGFKDVKWWDISTNNERRVFTINVENLSPTEIDEYIRRIQGNWNQQNMPIIDHIPLLTSRP